MKEPFCRPGCYATLTAALALVAASILLTGCETPQGSAASAAVFNANAALAASPNTAIAWGLLGSLAAADAQMQQEVKVAEAGRSQVNVYTQGASQPTSSQVQSSDAESVRVQKEPTLFASLLGLDEVPNETKREINREAKQKPMTFQWGFDPLEDPKSIRADAIGRLVDADGFVVSPQSIDARSNDIRRRISFQHLTLVNQIQLLSLEGLAAQIAQSSDTTDQRQVAEQLLKSVKRFNLENLNYPRGWIIQGRAAIALDREIEGRMAARNLMELRAEESINLKVLDLMSSLEERGWLPK